jgi:hypothetical protein
VQTVFKSGSLNLLETSGLVQACNGIFYDLSRETASRKDLVVTKQNTGTCFFIKRTGHLVQIFEKKT